MSILMAVCRVLVALHPRDVRRTYGREMRLFAEDAAADARRHRGVRGARRVLLRSALGLARSLVGFWIDRLRGRTTSMSSSDRGGDVRSHRSSVRSPAGAGVWLGWAQDGTQAIRGLSRAPAFTALAVGLLAVAIGANTAIFSTFYQTVVRPLPFPQPDRLAIVWGSNPQDGQVRDVISGSTFVDYRRDNTTFDALAAVHTGGLVLIEDGRPWIADGLEASVDIASVLGLEPHLGRWFSPLEGMSTGAAAVMLGYDFWQRQYGGSRDILGKRLLTHRGPVTVVGVLPADLVLPWPTDVLIPLHDDALAAESRTHYHYWLLGRLRGGVSAAVADADLDAIMSRIGEREPGVSNWEARVEPLHATLTEPVRPALTALLWAVGLLLLITGANVANLLLVRSSARQGELAVRAALGAGRSRLARQLLIEGLALGLAGAAFGLLLAQGLTAVLPSLAPETVTIGGSAASVSALRWGLGPASLAFAAILGISIGVLLVLPSMIRLPRAGAGQALRRASLRTTDAAGRRRRDVLVTFELALATVLLAMAGLSIRSTARLLSIDPGVQAPGVATLLFGDLQDADARARSRFYREVLVEVGQLPGVTAFGINDYVPFQGEDDFQGVTIEGRPPPPPGQGVREEWRRVSWGYFGAAGMPVVGGRGFSEADEADGAPSVVVVNQAFAYRHFPGEDPIGQRMDVHHGAYRDSEIVGVVADVRARGLDQPAPPTFYSPFPPGPRPGMALFVRTEGNPEAWIDPIKEAVWRVDAHTPVHGAMPLTDVVAQSLGIPRLLLTLVGALGAIALLLAGIGVFGVIAYSVRMRRRELGVRMAMGASPETVRRMVLRRGLALSALGLSIGVVGAIALGRVTDGLWFGVGGFDPLSLSLALVVLLAAALLASYLPASLAARTNPVESLRAE